MIWLLIAFQVVVGTVAIFSLALLWSASNELDAEISALDRAITRLEKLGDVT